MTSVELFLYEESDFTGYYNNYLKFLFNGFNLENFEYGAGIEVILPFINYLLSLVLKTNNPYLVLYMHSFFLMLLIYYLIYLISKHHKLELKETILLFTFTIVLFKYGTALNHLRQTYASIFILIAIFSKNNKYIFILLSIFTHLSSIIIYPLVKFLLMERSAKRIKMFTLICILMSGTIYILFFNFYSLIMHTDFILLEKIKFALIYLKKDLDITKYLMTSSVASFYLIILALLFFLLKNNKVYSQWNLYAMIVFLISFSFLPGISFRLLDPILTISIGYLFFKYLRIELKLKQAYLVGILIIIFFQFKWMIFNIGYYQKYPWISYKPFYYIFTYFEQKDLVDRYSLPHLKDVNIENKYKP